MFHSGIWRVSIFLVCLCGTMSSLAQEQPALPDSPRPQPGIIVGTVIDLNNDPIPTATVVLQSSTQERPRTSQSNDHGFFQFKDVEPRATYHVTISAEGFANWTSPDVVLEPGQYVILKDTKLLIAATLTTVDVTAAAASPEEIAAQQVKIEEQQRVFGILPNFYVVYDQNAAPLTAKLKFQLRLRSPSIPSPSSA